METLEKSVICIELWKYSVGFYSLFIIYFKFLNIEEALKILLLYSKQPTIMIVDPMNAMFNQRNSKTSTKISKEILQMWDSKTKLRFLHGKMSLILENV